jgi:hypothetical protein
MPCVLCLSQGERTDGGEQPDNGRSLPCHS